MTLLMQGAEAFLRLRSRQGHAALALVFAAAVGVAGGADFVGFEEQHLGHAFVGVDLGRQWCGVGKLQGHVAFPFRLQRGDVDDDAAAGVGAFAQADHQCAARDAKVLHRARQREAVGRDDAGVAFHVDKTALVEILRVHHGRVEVGEHFEFIGAAHVVAIARRAVADDAMAVAGMPNLTGLEWLDHAVLLGHAADPVIGFDGHFGAGNGDSGFGIREVGFEIWDLVLRDPGLAACLAGCAELASTAAFRFYQSRIPNAKSRYS